MSADREEVTRHGAVEATVQTGALETSYRRAGSGQAAVLLRSGLDPDRDSLFHRVAEQARVIEPVCPAGIRVGDGPGSAWSAWLSDFIDGLGLDRPMLLVDPSLAGAARRLQRHDPGRFGPVVVIAAELDAEGCVGIAGAGPGDR